jgi:hypothetical protein
MLIDISRFINVEEDDINKNCFTDSSHFKYFLDIPKLEKINTGEEFIKACKFIKNLYSWSDDEFVVLFVKATCVDKKYLPTKKDLEGQIRKLKKKIKK